tara:strand:+ start:1509 stop:1694 length:186 start_codon:yes stop_codon:yes gene_type:complete
MKYFFYLFFLIIYSCGYPDLDSVPEFDQLVITEEESIDLCNLTNTDKRELSECLNKINNTD